MRVWREGERVMNAKLLEKVEGGLFCQRQRLRGKGARDGGAE